MHSPKRFLTTTLVVTSLVVSAASSADPRQTATAFLRETPRGARQTLATAPGGRQAMQALGEVLERGKLDQRTLRNVIANPHARPYLVNTLKALKHVDGVDGVGEVLTRMSSSRDTNSMCGPSFEIIAGAGLQLAAQRGQGSPVRGIGTYVGRHEVDALLADGTRVEIKYITPTPDKDRLKKRAKNAMAKAKKQLVRRCAGGAPAMVVIPSPIRRPDGYRNMAKAIGSDFTVVAVDPSTCQTQQVFHQQGRRHEGHRNSALGRGSISRRCVQLRRAQRHPLRARLLRPSARAALR